MLPASASAHSNRGGLRAALFINGVQVLETTAIAAVGNNLITYVLNDMHYSLSKSANIVTNFVATTFLLSILGGFLSDSYLGSFLTIAIFGFIELLGYIVIALQAHLPSLKPEVCDVRGVCEEAKGVEAVVLFVGLYMIAVGSGCLKPNIIAYGGDQFASGRRRAKYFNMAYLSFCVGEVIALTLLVWIQSQYGMDLGFGVSAGVMFFALLILTSATPFYLNRPPQGSIFTHILQVVVVGARKKKLECASNRKMSLELNENTSRRGHERETLTNPDQLRLPEQGAMMVERESSREEEQVKLLIRVMPIFGCTIVTNCILAQLQTFSVEQASSMERRVGGGLFQVPAASVQAIPYIIMLAVVPLYDTVCVPFLRRLTGNEGGISQLQRIGIGLFLSTLSMLTAAAVESKRKAVEPPEKLSVLWIAPQFVIFGFSEMFTAVGLLEFFYSQSVAGMQSFLTALTYCSYSFGFFLSSALVSLVNAVTKTRNEQGWLSHDDLNEDHLDLFYWLLSALSFLNFFHYLFWSRWFKYYPTHCQGS